MNTVCITLNEDGTYSVYMEGEDMAAEGMPTPEPQTFESADEACQAAISMLGGGESQEPMIEGEDQFVQGFKGARGIEQGF